MFGGVYANPYALRALLDDARERGCDELYCLGDLGGFGAECDAVWPLLLEHGVTTIAGNYDVAIGRGDDDCGCGYADPRDNAFAQVMYDHTRAHTSAPFAAWMAALPGELRGEIGGVDVHMVHGSPLAINDFLWESLPDDELALRARASGGGAAAVHAHRDPLAAVGRRHADRQRRRGRAARQRRPPRRRLRRDRSRRRHVERVELVALAYDWRAQAASMRAAALPEPFVETIETGWWTTCLEIVPPRERARGAFHVYRDALPELAGEARPVVSLFGTALFPPRLWVYTNFHCNLACDYCVVASSPARAAVASSHAQRFRALVDEAVREGFGEIYITGGEPFVHPQIVAMIEYACERLPTVVLTNAMLFTGRRRAELAAARGPPGPDAAVLDRRRARGDARPLARRRLVGRGRWTACGSRPASACRCASR